MPIHQEFARAVIGLTWQDTEVTCFSRVPVHAAAAAAAAISAAIKVYFCIQRDHKNILFAHYCRKKLFDERKSPYELSLFNSFLMDALQEDREALVKMIMC